MVKKILEGKSKFLLLFLILAVVVSLSACTTLNNNYNYNDNIVQNSFIKDVDVLTAKKIIDENKNNNDFVILDVRTPEEFNSGRIENSENINFYSSDFKEQLSKLDKNKVYLVYCRSGSRSAKAVKIMEELGFKKVYNVEGGIISWKKNNLPLIYS